LLILSDALEDAGCDHVEILSNLRNFSFVTHKHDIWAIRLLQEAFSKIIHGK
jgi:hypothetical protein